MFQKPCLWLTCPETHYCLLHYVPNSQANPQNLFISLHTWRVFSDTYPYLQHCSFEKMSSKFPVKWHVNTFLPAFRDIWEKTRGWKWEVNGHRHSDRDQNPVNLIHTFKKCPSLHDYCSLGVKNYSLHYQERDFRNLKWLPPSPCYLVET